MHCCPNILLCGFSLILYSKLPQAVREVQGKSDTWLYKTLKGTTEHTILQHKISAIGTVLLFLQGHAKTGGREWALRKFKSLKH